MRETVGLWMLARLPEVTDLPGGYEAIGVARGERLVGGCLYTNYTPHRNGGGIHMWAVGHDWLSRRVIHVMFGYPFGQLRCHRITTLTAKKNKPSRRLLEGLGFRLEGVAREGYAPGVDACLYGLLKAECRWL